MICLAPDALRPIQHLRATALVERNLERTPGVPPDESKPSSVAVAILVMVSTAATGWLPDAVSPESITAVLPCLIAVETSLTSARVGLGLSVIDSSICVATMTTIPHQSGIDNHLLR